MEDALGDAGRARGAAELRCIVGPGSTVQNALRAGVRERVVEDEHVLDGSQFDCPSGRAFWPGW